MDIQKEKEPKLKKVSKSKLQELADEGINSYYVRFHQDIPPGENKEPVGEFRLKSSQTKYVVERIVYTSQGVIWTAFGETNIVPLANVMYCRLTL